MNTVFELLAKLNKKELGGFKHHLKTGVGQRTITLHQVVAFWEKHRSSPLSPKTVFRQVYPAQSYTNQRWYTVITHLQSELEYYLTTQVLRRDKLLQKRLLLRFFRKRNIRYFFERVYRQFRKMTAKLPQYEAHDLLAVYEGQEIYYDYVASQSRKKTTNLQVLSDQLDIFFVIEKLKQLCRQYSRMLINKKEHFDIRFAETVPKTVGKDAKLLEHPVIQLYYSCWEAVVQNGLTEAYLRFYRLLQAPPEGVSKQDMRDLFLMAANYSIRRLNQGDDKFGPITLDIYERSLSNGYLLEDGELPANTFSNIVSLGLQQKRYEWITDFIRQYAVVVPLPMRASLVALSQARLYYSQGQTDEALPHLLRVGTMAEPWLYLSAQSLKLKIFYELDSFDLLDHHLDNLQRYLQRTSLGYHAHHYQQLVHFLRRLLQLAPSNHKARTQLEKDILVDPKFREKEWLVRMLRGE